MMVIVSAQLPGLAASETRKPIIGGLCWLPEADRPAAVIVCIHGAAMWAGSFREFGHEMCKRNIATYAVNIRGFGPWARDQRGWCKPDPNQTVQDIIKAIDHIQLRYPNTPLFLLGESAGACLAIRIAASEPDKISGVICSCPAWKIRRSEKLFTEVVSGKLLHKKALVGMAVRNLIKQATSSRELEESWRQSPNYRFEYSADELLSQVQFLRETGSVARQVDKVPVLMVQGLADRLVKPAGTARLFKQIASGDKQLLLDVRSEHLIFQEVLPDPALHSILNDWLQKHATPAALRQVLVSDVADPAGLILADRRCARASKICKRAGVRKTILIPTVGAP